MEPDPDHLAALIAGVSTTALLGGWLASVVAFDLLETIPRVENGFWAAVVGVTVGTVVFAVGAAALANAAFGLQVRE